MAKRRSPSKRSSKREAPLQKSVIHYLEMVTKCPRVIRVNSGTLMFKRKNGEQGFVKLAKKGTADIIACMPDGRFGAFETKGTSPEPTDDQWAFIRAVREAGGIAGPVRNMEELREILRAGGYER